VSSRTIVDAGPLIAFLNEADSHHVWATDQLTRLPPPLLTCEAVLTETCFLLAKRGGNPADVFRLAVRGALRLEFSLTAELEPARQFMHRYANAGVSLADACLVRMSELHSNCRVLTLDRNFLVYRRNGRQMIPLIAPFA
jgi:predicted nucleic acid-binding protein